MKENNRSANKKPKFVIVYNELLQQILDGVYPEGGRLPSEPDLAAMLGVSRMTLREALNLLKEDGIIENRQGVGNFIRKMPGNHNLGLTKIENPLKKCLNFSVSHSSLRYNIESSKKYHSYMNYIFSKNTTVIFGADRQYQGEEKAQRVICHSVMNISVLDRFSIDIEQEGEVRNLLEEEVYSLACRSSLSVTAKPKDELTRDRELISEKNVIMMMTEILYDHSGEVLLHNKYFIPVEFFNFQVSVYNR